MIGLQGVEPGREDDPLWLILPSPLDGTVLDGPLPKDRREDLQILGFSLAVSLTADGGHPLDIRPGGDPPDRIVRVKNGRPHSMELTELTASDVRHELAVVRQLGRDLHERLASESSRRTHLLGRRVVIAALPPEPLPRDTRLLLDKLVELLDQDRGCVGDGMDVSKGLPERLPDRGMYGHFGPVFVSVYADGAPGDILVSAGCQAEIRLREALQALEARVGAKDTPASEVLLMSCGMPDERGYQCPLDLFMFQFIAENRSRLSLSPRHLKGVFLHLWGTNRWLQLYRSQDPIQWPPIPAEDRHGV